MTVNDDAGAPPAGARPHITRMRRAPCCTAPYPLQSLPSACAGDIHQLCLFLPKLDVLFNGHVGLLRVVALLGKHRCVRLCEAAGVAPL